MSSECFPMTALPHTSRLFADFLGMGQVAEDAPVRGWYGTGYATSTVSDPNRLANALAVQAKEFGAGEAVLGNIERLRGGARALVTGQQVGLFGGPLLTLLKAATAVARAKQATDQTGVPHVPVFWLATEGSRSGRGRSGVAADEAYARDAEGWVEDGCSGRGWRGGARPRGRGGA